MALCTIAFYDELSLLLNKNSTFNSNAVLSTYILHKTILGMKVCYVSVLYLQKLLREHKHHKFAKYL